MSAVSVIIPNYNGQSLLKKNLPLVVKVMRAGDELIVVDDASTDASVEWLNKEFQTKAKISIKIIQNEVNLRFAASVNKGVAAASSPHVFILNSDVIPHTGVIEQLLKHFENPQVFAVGCSEQEESGQKGGKNQLFFRRGLFAHQRATEFSTGPTAWVSGGSGMFDRKKWLELGGFDVAFSPAYWEDVDLSMRARKRGWIILFDAEALVDHRHETTNSSVFGERKIAAMSWKNGLYFTRKHANWWQKVQYWLWKPYWWWRRPN
jgi:GT2 family glycosyltransferase